MLAGLATLIAGRDHRAAGGAGPLRMKRERVWPVYRPKWLVRELAAAPPRAN